MRGIDMDQHKIDELREHYDTTDVAEHFECEPRRKQTENGYHTYLRNLAKIAGPTQMVVMALRAWPQDETLHKWLYENWPEQFEVALKIYRSKPVSWYGRIVKAVGVGRGR